MNLRIFASGTNPSSPLSPSGAQPALSGALNAYGTVTAYANGIQNTEVYQLSGQGDWYGPFSQSLSAAKKHAEDWTATIGPAAFAGIPNSIIKFGTIFNSATNDISGILASGLGGTLSSGQTEKVQELVGALMTTIDDILGPSGTWPTILALSSAISGFGVELVNDHSGLVTAHNGALSGLNLDEQTLATLTGEISYLQSTIQSLNQDIAGELTIGGAGFAAVALGLAFAGPEAAGLLVVAFVGLMAAAGAVTLAAVAESGVTAAQQQLNQDMSELSDEQAQIITLKLIVNSLGSLVSNNQQAQAAVGDIAGMFATLRAQVGDVLADLSGVEPDVPTILEQLNLQVAVKEWSGVMDYAKLIQDSAFSSSTLVLSGASAVLPLSDF